MKSSLSITSLPSDILAEIALALVTNDPSIHTTDSLAAFIATAKFAYNTLSLSANPALYIRLFKHLFDRQLITTRIGRPLDAHAYSRELIIRCRALRAFRNGDASTTQSTPLDSEELEQFLWTAYLMVLEDEGLNSSHLKEFAKIGNWVTLYLFNKDGGSSVASDLARGSWPSDKPATRLAVWLLWFLTNTGELTAPQQQILKVFALGAHQYRLSDSPWQYFSFGWASFSSTSDVEHYAIKLVGSVPSLVPASTLAYLSNHRAASTSPNEEQLALPLGRAYPLSTTDKEKALQHPWEAEWRRSTRLNHPSWVNGCIDGAWEGSFTFMDFHEFNDMLHGAPPCVLQRSFVAQNEQFWVLREYHLFKLEDSCPTPNRLPSSDALAGFIPRGCHITERGGTLTLAEPGKDTTVDYVRWNPRFAGLRSLDVIVIGDGHSNWGRFTLRGRVRAGDGLVTLIKDYTEGPRGRWLYRGYAVGHPRGNFVGRWRDTITPAVDGGYEGCFALTRRR